MGAHVVVAARNPTKAAAAVEGDRGARAGARRSSTLPIDLASFASVRAFADTFNDALRPARRARRTTRAASLHKRTVTDDGHETQFQVNHLSHFLLTQPADGPLAAPRRRRG